MSARRLELVDMFSFSLRVSLMCEICHYSQAVASTLLRFCKKFSSAERKALPSPFSFGMSYVVMQF